jgi:hypothetical protein
VIYRLQPRLTTARLAYLRAVEANPPYSPRHHSAACQCLRFGWVENVARFNDGSIGPYLNYDGRKGRVAVEWLGTQLTDAGRAILATSPAQGD